METKRKSAIVAGIALIIMAVVAALTYGYLHNTIVVPGITETTIAKLNNFSSLLITEISGWLLILVLDVVVAWSLFLFFKMENRRLSFTTATLRIVFVIVFGVAIFQFFPILKIVNGNLAAAPTIINHNILSHLVSFENTWSVALIIFGFHLLFLGVMAIKSKTIHRTWGIFLVFAAVSYILVNSSKQIFPEFDQIKTIETFLSLPMAFGEIGFAFWLLFRGGKNRIVYRRNKNGQLLHSLSNEVKSEHVRLS